MAKHSFEFSKLKMTGFFLIENASDFELSKLFRTLSEAVTAGRVQDVMAGLSPAAVLWALDGVNIPCARF